MINTELYERLGVTKDATASQIRHAYKRCAKTMHPDKGGDEKTFQDIVEAYEVLSSPHKRLMYDTSGQKDFSNALSHLGKFRDMLFSEKHGTQFLKCGYDYLTAVRDEIEKQRDTTAATVKHFKQQIDEVEKSGEEFPRLLPVMQKYLQGLENKAAMVEGDLKLCEELTKEYKAVMVILGIPTVTQREVWTTSPSTFMCTTTGV